jgi:hypothetical protein
MKRRDFNALVGGAAVVRLAALAVAVLLFAAPFGGLRAASPVADAAQGDFAGFVDLEGGRRVYLECRGTGSPVVVLEAGYRSSARIWSEDHKSGAPRTMVLAGVAAFTRVCAYDRPGTVAPLNDNVRQSRSDPVPMPRTAATPSLTSTHCCARQASPVHTSSRATRWAASSSGSTPAPILVTSSGSSSSTPILRCSKRC